MSRKPKRILSAALACVMALSLLPASALAVDTAANSTVSTGGNGVEITKTVTANNNGTYQVEMDAYVEGSVQAASGTPLDIVLVLDQSGSMAYGKNDYLPTNGEKSRTAQLKEAVSSFVTSISNNAKEYNVDHRIAIVGYASAENTGPTSETDTTNYPINGSTTNWVNTGLYVNGVFKNYGDTYATSYTYEEVYTLNSNSWDIEYFILVNGEYVRIYYSWGGWGQQAGWYYTTGRNTRTYIVPKTSADDSDPSHFQVYTQSSSTVTTPGLTNADYQAALVSVNTGNSVTSSITTAINSLAASGGTYTEYGLEMAKKVFDNNSAEEGRQRIVVLFTDGETDSNINTVLTTANTLKGSGYNAAIYTVGFYTTTETATFLDYISSNYITASYSNKKYSGTKSEGTIDYSQTSNGDLTTVFKNIAESIQPSVTVDSGSILTDTVSTYFVPSGVTTDDDGKITSGVTVYKVPAAGNDSSPTWGNKTDITSQVTVTLSDKTINVTGFDYSADKNLVVQKNGAWQGNKLVLAFNITTDTSYTGWQKGTNYYPTNDTDSSKAGLTYGIGSTLLSASPKAPVTAYSVTYNGNGSTSGTVPAGGTYLAGTDVAVSGNTGSLTKTGYTFDGWNTQADGKGTAYAADGKISSIGANIDLYAQWKKDDSQTQPTSYTVKHVVAGEEQTADTKTYSGTAWINDTDPQIVIQAGSLDANTYVGYKLSTITPNVKEGDEVDSGTVITLTYVKDASQTKPTSYTVKHVVAGEEQTADTKTYSGTAWINDTDPQIVIQAGTLAQKSYTGYKFDSISPNVKEGDEVDSGTVITLTYVKDASQTKPTSYTVKHVVAGEEQTADTKTYSGTAWINDTDPQIVIQAGTLAQKSYTGYKFDSISPNVKEGDEVDSGTVITLTYVKDDSQTKDLSYTVEYYKDDVKVEGDTQTVTVSVWINDSGTTLTVDKDSINTTDKYTGYVFEATNPAEIPDTIENGGVIKVYYTKDVIGEIDKDGNDTGDGIPDKYQIVVKYVAGSNGRLDGTTYQVFDLRQEGSDELLTIVTLTFPTPVANNGYRFSNWTYPEDVTVTGTEMSDFTPGTVYVFVANFNKTQRPPVTPPSKPTLNTEDHVAYIIGYEDGTVKPNNNITRAEVATIFFRLLSDDSRAQFWTQTNSYSDVALTNWFNNAVSTLSNAGVITGYPNDTFKPNASITRAEFAAIAARFSDAEATGICSFTDVPANHWAASYIALAEELGWINGYSDGTFRPNQPITRAEAMTLINRVLERAVDEDHMLSDMVTWVDNQPSDWFYEAVQEATNSHDYTRTTTKVPSQSFCYENWVKILEAPDWAALENAWSTANGQ